MMETFMNPLGWAAILVHETNPDLLARVKAELTFDDLSADFNDKLGFKSDKPRTVSAWREHDGVLFIPRRYADKKRMAGFGDGLRCNVSEHVFPPYVEPQAVWPVAPDLRAGQIDPWNALMGQAGEDKILVLGCGRGKTVMALRYARECGHRALVIVDRIELAEQWERCGVELFGLDNKDIGRVYAGKFSTGDALTVTTFQSLAALKDRMDPTFWSHFSLVIVDEVHVAGAPTFLDVLPMFSGERLGLSATPDRKDGLDPLFKAHIGGGAYCYVDTTRDVPGTYCFVPLPALVTEAELYGSQRRMRGIEDREGKPVYALMRPKYYSLAAENNGWNEVIAADIASAVGKGRGCLVLCESKAHIDNIAEKLNNRGLTFGIMTSAVNRKTRRESLTAPIILATPQIAGKGLDVPHLDTLFVMCPHNDIGRIRQEKGRIDGRGREGKKPPLIVIYVHSAVKQLRKRAAQMEQAIREFEPEARIMHLERKRL